MEIKNTDYPELTRRKRTASKIRGMLPAWISPLFLLSVITPTVVATLYFGLIASDIFISESRFIVRTQGRPAPTGLASLIPGAIGDPSGSAMSAVSDYAVSRDAMTALNEQGRLTRVYTRPRIDIFNRLAINPQTASQEDLYRHFIRHVALDSEGSSGIATLVVQAYQPQDAHWINSRLLDLSEALVNQLNERSKTDLVRYAASEVEEAKRISREATSALAAYRNKHGIIDPEEQAAVSLAMISKLQDEVIQTKAQLDQMRAFTPQNPQIPVLRDRVETFERQIEAEMMKVAGGKESLAAKSAEYTRLAVDAEYADKLLANALESLQNASNDARRQQVYIERIVQPNEPDEAMEPRRLRAIFSVFVLGLAVWGVLSLLFAATREHND